MSRPQIHDGCSTPDCSRPHHAGGFCDSCYRRENRRGLSLQKSYERRFWEKVDRRSDSECWPWLSPTQNGYGYFRHEGRNLRAPRVAYELLVGPIPEGLTLDHLCRNRSCVNPAHLEPVSTAENVRRGFEARKGGFRDTKDAGVVTEPELQNAAPGDDPGALSGKYVVEPGGIRRASDGAFQMSGIVCPDCRGEIIGEAGGFPIRRKPEGRWCPSPHHPVFDATGRLIQATPSERAS